MTAPSREGPFRPLPLAPTLAALAFCALVFVAMAALSAPADALGPLDRLGQTVAPLPEGSPLAPLVVAYTTLGNNEGIALWTGLIGALLLVRRRWAGLARLVAATAVGGFVLWGLKGAFGRPRPVSTFLEPSGLSFPSGHAFNAAVLGGLALYLLWRYARPGLGRALGAALVALLAVLMAASRVILSVHYPTDALAGLAAGSAWALAVLLLADAVEGRGGREASPPPRPTIIRPHRTGSRPA